jgi:Tol biopolymer transport system component
MSRPLAACALALAIWSTATDRIGAQDGHRRPDRNDPATEAAAPVTRITTIVENGGRLDWSSANGLIAFDRRIGDGYFDIYTMTPSGGNQTCLTCGKTELPPKSKGNPAWHPSGNYIVFQAQNTYPGLAAIAKPLGKITDYAANPGAGINNDIWVMDRQGRRFWRLVEVKPRIGGVLHPQFSRQGDKLFWSERVSPEGGWGRWALRVADFAIVNGTPRISNERTFRPGAQQRMYESHGFNNAGDELLFSGNLEPGQEEVHGDIYLYNMKTGQLKNLTNSPDDWDEHAHFSPDGKTIVWMTSKTLPARRRAAGVATDYWMMNADGSNKRRLTFFNTPGHPESMKTGVVAADFAWSPDGSQIAAYLITDVRTGGKIVMITLR